VRFLQLSSFSFFIFTEPNPKIDRYEENISPGSRTSPAVPFYSCPTGL
jgi:hypothetical protein